MPDQCRHVEDHADLAVADDGGAGYRRYFGKQGSERLDHRLALAVDTINDQARLAATDAHDDDAWSRMAGSCFAENFAQANKGQRLVAQFEVVQVTDIGWQFDTLDHHVERNDEVRTADADMKAIDDRQGQRQTQPHGGALPRHRLDIERAAQGLDVAAHDIHANAAPGKVGNLLRRGKARREYQSIDVLIGEYGIGGHHTALDGFLENALAVEAAAIVLD